MHISELKIKLQSISIKQIHLDKATFITDVPKFIDSHISFLERNSGNKKFLPYYNRLLKLLDLLPK